MPKQGDIDYLKNAGHGTCRHAADKPFSDGEFPKHLIDLGLLAGLLPPPPGQFSTLVAAPVGRVVFWLGAAIK